MRRDPKGEGRGGTPISGGYLSSLLPSCHLEGTVDGHLTRSSSSLSLLLTSTNGDKHPNHY